MFSLLVFVSILTTLVDGATRSDRKNVPLDELEYSIYPRRSEDEAAVIEWGHSAIISALDASVAYFGPQTSQAALLEVECMPVLASPLNGAREGETLLEEPEQAEEEGGEGEEETQAEKKHPKQIVKPLDNADEVHGNMVVMTNRGNLSGLHMAKIAKASGAAALLIVNIDEKRPDDIYRLRVEDGEEGAEDIDIPVVMISMNSANVLTSATVTNEMTKDEIVNHGMPERVRLYAGGDRPFFEDVEPSAPTLYLIHNMLTYEECDTLIEAADPLMEPVTKDDVLQMTLNAEDVEGVQRVMLWQGMLQSPAKKAIEERLEQVTGFPSAHYSGFVIDKLEPGAHWKPHFDAKDGQIIPTASITIFLSEECGPLVYPMSSDPVKIVARKGMAVVHHNTNDRHKMDRNTWHALMKSDSNKTVYVARKYVYPDPVPTSRALALPVFAFPFGGKLPKPVVELYDYMVEQFGPDGEVYFDKLCIFFPMLIILGLVQLIGTAVHSRMKANAILTSGSSSSKSTKSKSNKKKDN